MKKILYILLMILFAVEVVSCSDKEDSPDLPEMPKPAHSVLVYMVADNNLSANASDDLKEMRQVAAAQCKATGGRWIVFFSGIDHQPRLIEFNEDGSEKLLKSYSTDESAVSISRMRQVISDFRKIAPNQAYGLVLWSHGTGWMDENTCVDESQTKSANMISPLSFGYDGSSRARMKVSSLARALDGQGFDYIYFDCCHMATAEVAYELRNAAKTMVACPTELGVEGMPYETNIEPLLKGDPVKAARNTFDYYQSHYNNYADATYHTIYGCAITAIDLTKMNALASATRAVFETRPQMPNDYYPVVCFRSITNVDGIYDMKDYITALTADSQLLRNWNDALNNVILYESHTPTVYNLPASNFCGLGHNILLTEEDANFYHYNTYAWWTDVVSSQFATE